MRRPHVIVSMLALLPLAAPLPAPAQQPGPAGVEIAWNRLYDHDEITALLHELAAAHPDLLELRSIGASEQGRPIWLMILNQPATGPHEQKPAMWIDGNVHGNEIQSSEVVLYSIWYLVRSYGKVKPLTELVDRAAFYFVPSVNPDGRARWFAGPSSAHSERSGQRPTDDDYDGVADEDGGDDLDGDGNLGIMWRADPNGTHRRSERDPRIFERVEPDERGEWSFAGSEGIDNDGDGRMNEDGPGGYDMNRNWPSGWQPDYVQGGAGDYPFSYPETRTIGAFILEHPNIAAGQSYHNSGGMILRGPGAEFREELYPRGDRRVYDELASAGAEMLPFYRSMVIHADLYTVHGGFVNWLAEGLGIVAFTNEMWSNRRLTQTGEGRLDDEARMEWIDRLLFGQVFTEYTEVDHPTFGRVLVGGTTRDWGRIPPPFMMEEELHRNFAFTMFHGGEMPLLEFAWTDVQPLGAGLWQVTVEVANEKVIPTRLDLAAQKRIGQPDRLSLAGEGVEVVASGTLEDRFDRTFDPREHRREVIPVEEGIPGRGRRTFRFIVAGPEGAEVTLRYVAEKARDVEARVRLGD